MTSTETKPESTENLEPIVFFEEEEDFNQLYEESLLGIKEQDIAVSYTHLTLPTICSV